MLELDHVRTGLISDTFILLICCELVLVLKYYFRLCKNLFMDEKKINLLQKLFLSLHYRDSRASLFFWGVGEGVQKLECNPPASEAIKEVANLTERKMGPS